MNFSWILFIFLTSCSIGYENSEKKRLKEQNIKKEQITRTSDEHFIESV